MVKSVLRWGLTLLLVSAVTGCIEAAEFQGETEADVQTEDTSTTVDGSTDGGASVDVSPEDTQEPDAEPTDVVDADAGPTDAGSTDTSAADTSSADVTENLPPDFTELVEAPYATEGLELTYDLEAIDPEGDTLTWTLTEGPPGLELDESTGTFTWTPEYNFVPDVNSSQPFFATFKISDDASPANVVSATIQGGVWSDHDEDGVACKDDGCPELPNQNNFNLDGDDKPDDCDPDIDGDGVLNSKDVCPEYPDPEQEDTDGDGEGDACDEDIDGDDIPNDEDDDIDGDQVPNDDDNCPKNFNPGDEDGDQDDLDEDGTGDACDSDLDGDGLSNDQDGDIDDDDIPNGEDNCPWHWNGNQDDFDEDGEGDECDDDIDGDGLSNEDDWCPEDPTGNEDTDGDDVDDCYDEDDDDDGYSDADDSCPLHVSDDDDLNYDVLNCGACGDPCDDSDGANVETWACDDGQCVIETCADGYVEIEGCQEQPVIYVDAFASGPGQGTEDDPYKTIQSALEKASGGTMLSLKAGLYVGNLSIGVDDIVLEGVGPETIIKSADDALPAVSITGDGVGLKSLKIVGGRIGLEIKGSKLSQLSGALIENVEIDNTLGLGGANAPLTAGLLVAHAQDVMIQGVHISEVSQAAHVNGSEGGDSVGALFDHVSESTVLELHVESVLGAQGIGSANPGDSPLEQQGFTGGSANGVRIKASSSLSFVNMEVSGVVGGKGGNGWKWGYAGVPGLGTGVLIDESQSISITEANIDQIWGGEGGYPGSGGGAEPMNGEIGSGFRITNSTSVWVSDFEVLNITGGKGSTVGDGWASGVGVSGTGVGVEVYNEATEITFERGLIGSLKGGPSALYYYPAGGATGVRLVEAGDVILKNLAIANLSSGDQIENSGQYANIGVEIDDAGPVTIQHLSLAAVNGTAAFPTEGAAGIMLGSSQTNSIQISNSILSEISGACIQGPSAAIESSTVAAYTLFHECDIDPDETGVALIAPDSGSPAFKNLSDNDLRVKSTSAAVDAGKPGDDYCGEPEPNGCMVNLGAFGNTDEAQSFGPDHCPCDD
ncbi:MAG: hypothetical protein CL940_08095 [Deltaproteobacteria bacterium]|nr:hypothetical protein [Deltaproteobacteria bacterium]